MTKPFELRPYQKAAVNAVVHRYKNQNQRRMLLFLPTGAGKTVIATAIIKSLLRHRRQRGKVLFIAHRQEILDQTARTIRRHLPHRTVEIEQGERTSDGAADITVASVQSLVRRKERYTPRDFDLIVCDECHRALAPSWEQVIDYFHTQAGEQALLLGMTATPRRSDGKSALDVFGRCAYEISRTDLEDLGYLVPMHYYTVQSNLNLDKVKLSGGDFQVNALSKVMDTAEVRALTLKAWMEQGKGKRTIAFCAGVDHAHHLAEDFLALGIPADKIDGKTKDRRKVLKRFLTGEIQVLTNYGVLTEGFDDPGVSCILMARPTTSPLVYTQCIGRGLRSAPNKLSCTVIDIVDRSTHQLQYGAGTMAGLSPKWRCKGADPFRQASSLAGIKVTSPEAFLEIRNAVSLEEVQSILMRLPPKVVVAGLDGEPVLRYDAPEGDRPGAAEARRRVGVLLRQAKARGVKIAVREEELELKFRDPETENEKFAYLKWHLSRVTGRAVLFTPPRKRQKRSNPRALLKSLLPDGCRIAGFSTEDDGTFTAIVTGLTPDVIDDIAADFRAEHGVELDLKGQMSLF